MVVTRVVPDRISSWSTMLSSAYKKLGLPTHVAMFVKLFTWKEFGQSICMFHMFWVGSQKTELIPFTLTSVLVQPGVSCSKFGKKTNKNQFLLFKLFNLGLWNDQRYIRVLKEGDSVVHYVVLETDPDPPENFHWNVQKLPFFLKNAFFFFISK